MCLKKMLWLTQRALTPLSEWIIFANCSKLQLSSGVTNSSRRLLLRTLDSILAYFMTLILYIIILHEKFKRALHTGIIHDHHTKKVAWNNSIEIIHNTDHKVWYFDYWIYCYLFLFNVMPSIWLNLTMIFSDSVLSTARARLTLANSVLSWYPLNFQSSLTTQRLMVY